MDVFGIVITSIIVFITSISNIAQTQPRSQIMEILEDEERSFRRTMTKGIEQFKKMAASSDNTLSGPDAFLLWDTFGFPVDLTQLMAEETGLSVDMVGYEHAMEEARQKARAAAKKGSAAEFKFEAEATAYLANSGVPHTDDLPKYSDADVEARVCALLTADGFVQDVKVRCGVPFFGCTHQPSNDPGSVVGWCCGCRA